MNYPQPPVPAKKGMSTIVIVIIVILLLVPAVIGVFAVMAIYGTRKYIANAKTAEARVTVGQIAKDAVAAYDDTHSLCRSASHPVPASLDAIRGKKYQSSVSDWDGDASSGFACLKFQMMAPQYFQYSYEATATSFTVRAHGDLNGDGVVSTFELHGNVVGGRVVIDPTITETHPEE